MFSPENLPDKVKYISLLTAAKYSGFYSQEYLSLRARQGKLKAVKVGRNWVTTKSWVDDYIHNDKNHKANGTVYNFTDKEVKEIEQEAQTFETAIEGEVGEAEIILAGQVEERNEEATGEPSLRPDDGLRRGEGKTFWKPGKKIYALAGILIFFGLIIGGLLLKPDIPIGNFLTQRIKIIEKQTNDHIVGFAVFIKNNIFGKKDEKEFLAENNLAPEIQKGLIVMPSRGDEEDEKIKERIRASFSDEVEVELKDDDSGLITPVFREKKGDDYMYIMVPINN